MGLQEFCIAAAGRYLEFLEEEKLGIIDIPIRTKTSLGADLWKLTLSRRLFDVDAIELKVRGQAYRAQEGGHFAVDSYDEDTGVLLIKLRGKIPGFADADESEIQVISSLRFLVERVRDWFVANGHQCRLPDRTGEVAPAPRLDLSPEQSEAYESALTSPCRYIWGPPGTGKTRYVLASAVIARLRQGRRVAVLAPTNLALDLALTSILEACGTLVEDGRVTPGEAGALHRNAFLRLGVPTRRFADEFPEVCEERGLRHRMAQHERQAGILWTVVRYRKNRDCVDTFSLVLAQLERAAESLRVRSSQILRRENLRQRAQSLERELASALSKLTGWLTGASARNQGILKTTQREIAALDGKVAACELMFAAAIQEIAQQRTGSLMLDNLFARIATLRVFDEDALLRVESHRASVSEVLAKTADFIASAKSHDQEYAEWSVEALEREIERLRAEIEKLKSRTTVERIREARVIACTLDTFIHQFRNAAVPVDHIFLDEACYAPVIKALTLFRRNIPVTFLGDHKQLPPVCEMNDFRMAQPENQCCILWARSALFVMHALRDPFPLWPSFYEHLEEPPRDYQFPRSTLTRTHRFGQNLASLLDELVYCGIGFTSATGNGVDLTIEVIPAARSDAARSNQNESRAAREWIDRNGVANVAILAPYKNQVALLSNTVPRELRDEVMTVHRSQGREWDTVILSATDTLQKAHFTDTERSIGRLVMNTAVSRARTRLVLICDRTYWLGRSDANRQLISRLIRAAEMGVEPAGYADLRSGAKGWLKDCRGKSQDASNSAQ